MVMFNYSPYTVMCRDSLRYSEPNRGTRAGNIEYWDGGTIAN